MAEWLGTGFPGFLCASFLLALNIDFKKKLIKL